MSVHLMLWCGSLRVAATQEATTMREVTRQREGVDLDFPASCNDLWLAERAALALGAQPGDMHAFVFDRDVLPPGFRGTYHNATVAELDRVSQRLTKRLQADDLLLFIASNHGIEQGLLVSEVDEFADEPSYLTPRELDRCFARLPGKQIILLATCFSGAFLELGTRADRVVVVSCESTTKYYLGIDDGDIPHSPFLRHLLGAWTGTEVPFGAYDPLIRRPLADAFEHAKNQLISLGRQCPLMSGAVTLP